MYTENSVNGTTYAYEAQASTYVVKQRANILSLPSTHLTRQHRRQRSLPGAALRVGG